jgi:membrane-associated phospholipid phosphatase
MYAEALLIGICLPSYGKALTQRIRPYVYNPDVPMDKKLSAESKKSFFSGHTSAAFTSTFFLSSVYGTYYPNSKWKPYILTGSILLASTVGYLRIAAGEHFLTDVLVGAFVGAAIGYIIPKIHETDNNNAIYETSDVPTRHPGVSFQFSF